MNASPVSITFVAFTADPVTQQVYTYYLVFVCCVCACVSYNWFYVERYHVHLSKEECFETTGSFILALKTL